MTKVFQCRNMDDGDVESCGSRGLRFGGTFGRENSCDSGEYDLWMVEIGRYVPVFNKVCYLWPWMSGWRG